MKKIVLLVILLVLASILGVYYLAIKKPLPEVKEAVKEQELVKKPSPQVKEAVKERELKEVGVEKPMVKELIFTSNRDGPPRIYSTDLEGKLINLVYDSNSVWDGLPSYSVPEKRPRIAFFSDRVSEKGIYILLEGKEVIRLIDGYDPALSPDGKMIAFSARGPGGDYEVYVIKSIDEVISRIKNGVKSEIDLINISDHPTDDWAPAWLSNERIVFTSLRDGNAEIYAVNLDKTNLVNLTRHPAWDGLPSCSRDGKIIFQSDRSGNFDIWQIDKDGNNPVNLTNHPSDDRWPAFSSDGSKIAFISNRESKGGYNIWVIKEGKLVRITDHPADDWAPAWTR